jgi:hypothetical protein
MSRISLCAKGEFYKEEVIMDLIPSDARVSAIVVVVVVLVTVVA